jgi:predicted metal-dependent hydrolase
VERPSDVQRTTAEAVERSLARHLREIEQRVIQLDAECDEWRRRAVAAEAALEQRTAELQAELARRDPTRGVDDKPPQPPVRRLRGNWLR